MVWGMTLPAAEQEWGQQKAILDNQTGNITNSWKQERNSVLHGLVITGVGSSLKPMDIHQRVAGAPSTSREGMSKDEQSHPF